MWLVASATSSDSIVIHLVLFARRGTRCGVAFLLSRDLSQVGSRSLWSRSWQKLCRRSWSVCSMCHRSACRNLVGKQVVDVPVPQILEQIVEVIKVILQEQCQCMRLFTFERRVVVAQQFLTRVFAGLVRVVVRLHKHKRQHGWTCPQPSLLSVSTIVVLERGPYSCLVMMKMKMKHTHTCHSQARVRANGDKRATWMCTPLRSHPCKWRSSGVVHHPEP